MLERDAAGGDGQMLDGMRIAIIGMGYVGLVSAACFAKLGVSVVGVDNDAGRVGRLEAGEIPIYEPGLDQLVARGRRAGRLTFTTDLARALAGAQIVFLAVGTPSRPDDGAVDLTYITGAVDGIAAALRGPMIVVTKSTVPVGTGRMIADRFRTLRPDLAVQVASNPEFLREGSAIEDFMRPDRVVIGVDGDAAAAALCALYAPIERAGTPLLVTSIETAEITKYAANSLLATKIAFVNEIADLCEKAGGDVLDVAHGIGLDRRIGAAFLNPGPGFGGSCFPKDASAFVATGRGYGAPQRIVEQVIASNHRRKHAVARRVVELAGGDLAGRTVAVLGLTFKPDTDDMREAPSLAILPVLQEAGAAIRAYDPAGMTEATRLLPGIACCDSAYDALRGADLAVLLTEWSAFRTLDLDRVMALMAEPLFIDLRNVFSPIEMAQRGFRYHSVGRGHRAPVARQPARRREQAIA
jgi:UDPglucose 6-dehydrogenase